ncbi:MAG TPA: hypothetical protein VLE23_09170 [Geminicoccaceae bacterium]|nr:hypothetical protein [Geminicoccaceae bacterium]
MKKILGAVAAAALAFTAGVALADEVSGEVQTIDATMKTFTIDEETFQWSENSTGVKLDELKEGDKVKVMFEANQDGHNDVMEIMKEE